MPPESPHSTGTPPRLILFARSVSQPAIIDTLHRSLGKATGLDYQVTNQAEELARKVSSAERVVVLVNCLLKEDIADIYNSLPLFEKRVAEGTVRILVLNSIRHPRLGPLLRSRCAIEILEIPVTLKALQYKIKNALSIVQRSQVQSEDSGHSRGLESANDASNRSRAKPKASQEVLWQSGYDFEPDCWLLPSRKNIRNVVGAWLIDLIGPGPVIGTWEELPGMERLGEKGWVWRPRSVAEDIFQTKNGRWIFFGKLPEFSWQKNLWSFVSKSPMFAYYGEQMDAPLYTRFEFRDGEGLRFLENSAHAESLLPRIKATFESRLGFGNANETDQADAGGEGSLGSWDFESEEAEGSHAVGVTPGSEGGPDWKDHTGAVGVAFGAKNLQIKNELGHPKPKRDALAPDAELGAALGLMPLDSTSIKAGGRAFDRIQLFAEAIRRNGENIATLKDLFIYDLNESGATLLLPAGAGEVGDRFHLRVRLETGQSKLECVMIWEFGTLDMELGTNRLASGVFRGGDFDPLFSLLDHLEARKKELDEFFKTARG